MNRKAIILACALLGACDSGFLAGGSSSTETGEPVSLTGSISGQGEGLSGVVVSLAGTSLSDTTRADGSYRLSGRVSSKEVGGFGTLRFTIQGQILGIRVLESLSETVVPLPVIQRGFLGYLKTNDRAVTRIVGVLTGDDIPAGDSVVATFFHNQVAKNYSGFMYFSVPSDSVRNYQIRVKVYGPNGRLLKTSPSVPFTNQAGNILISPIEL